MVKLIEKMSEVPRKIGEANIVFQGRQGGRWDPNPPPASRSGKTIILDQDAKGKFYSISGGQKFLFTANTTNRENDDRRSLFFGGMDESPFLVELEYRLVEDLVSGEESFLSALKPSAVKKWETLLESEAKRQGDFFAVASRNKVNWDSFFMSYLNVNGSEITMTIVKDFSLKGTRHGFTGILGKFNGLIVCQGRIEAPDHEPLLLEQPHLIEQSEGFVKPQEAD